MVLDGQDHRVSVRGEWVCVGVCGCVCVTHADTAKACSLTALITSLKRILHGGKCVTMIDDGLTIQTIPTVH